MTPGPARSAALGGGWSLILTDLAALLLCFFSLAIALTPPARLEPIGVARTAATLPTATSPVLDTATSSNLETAAPAYVEALLRDRLSTIGSGITMRRGPGIWVLRFDDLPPAAAVDDLLQAIAALPVWLTVTLVTPDPEIWRKMAQRSALAQELGGMADRVLVSQGPRRALEIRLASR